MQSQKPSLSRNEENLSELGQRIAQIAEQLGGKRALAEKTGLSEGQIYRYIKGENSPTIEALLKIANTVNASVEWLARGSTAHLSPVSSKNGDFESVNTVYIPGSTTIGFTSEWLSNRKFGRNPNSLQVLQIELEQGMQPTLGIGDLVIVDTSKREIELGIYYIRLEGSINMVKRLQKLNRNTVRIISDDRAYESLSVPIEKLEILGQVVWIAKEYSSHL